MIIKLKATSVNDIEMLFHLDFIERSFSITQLGASVTRVGWFEVGIPVSVEVYTDSMEFLN